MSAVIQQGLMITIIGMGLVFVVIIFLWWLMGLLVRATTKETKAPVEAGADEALDGLLVPEIAGIEKQRQAAAAAVAVGLAIAQSRARRLPGGSLSAMGGTSPWQSVHRARQLEQTHKRG